MKTAVSIPDKIFVSAEKLAEQLGQSRSQLYAKALNRYVKEHRNEHVTDKLDEIYTASDSAIDPVLLNLQTRSLSKNRPW